MVDRQAIVRERRRLQRQYSVWSNRARRSYGIGIIMLLAGMTLLLVPERALGDLPIARLAVIGLMALAVVIEVLWQTSVVLVARARKAGKRTWTVRVSERIAP